MNHLNEEGESEMNPTTIGLDIAKNVFQVPGVNGRGKGKRCYSSDHRTGPGAAPKCLDRGRPPLCD